MNTTYRTDPGGMRTRWSDDLAQRYLAEGHWLDTTLVDTARAMVAANPDKVLLTEGDRQLTRRRAWDQALRLAAFFHSRGLKPGDVVAFQLPNWTESAIISLATRMMGLIINPIPPIYRESELAYILADCGAKLIFVPQVFRKVDHASMLEALKPSLPQLSDIVVVRGDGALSWDSLMDLAPLDDADLPKVDPSAVLMVMYTSGTTGRPKGVLHHAL